MRSAKMIGRAVAAVLLAGVISLSACQTPAVLSVDEKVLSEYPGTYQWEPTGFLYLQMWNELSGTNQLVAFDESGDVRTLYPAHRDHFFAGSGAAIPAATEAQIVST